ncbi:hypothetical protein MK489_08665 [Myxococcota bacterium]|nr:hypothetical protein [Myxococcota bacterium]
MTACHTMPHSAKPLEDSHDIEANQIRASLSRAQLRLRKKLSHLELLQSEERRYREDAEQLKELLTHPQKGPGRSLIRSRTDAKRTLRRFLQKRRRIARLRFLIGQIEEEITWILEKPKTEFFQPDKCTRTQRSLEALMARFEEFPGEKLP